MTAIVITAHAAQRYVERIDPSLSIEQARAEIHTHERAVSAAHSFGCTCVKLANRGRLILDAEGAVVTVLGADQYRRTPGAVRL